MLFQILLTTKMERKGRVMASRMTNIDPEWLKRTWRRRLTEDRGCCRVCCRFGGLLRRFSPIHSSRSLSTSSRVKRISYRWRSHCCWEADDWEEGENEPPLPAILDDVSDWLAPCCWCCCCSLVDSGWLGS